MNAAVEVSAKRFVEVPPERLIDSPFQPRIDYTGMDELRASIRAEGRVHTPLLARERPDGGIELVFGHRRKYGALAEEVPTVTVELRDMTDAQVRSAQMAENVQRESMKALEEARGMETLWGKSIAALSKRLDTMSAAELTTMLLDIAIVDNVVVDWHSVKDKPGPLLALAAHYGIDAKGVMEAASTPSTAGASAEEAPAAASKAKAPAKAAKGSKSSKDTKPAARAVKYRNPATGETWTGRGLKPQWLKVAMEGGATLASFEVKDKAGSAGKSQKDDAGSAGDLFEAAEGASA